MGNHLVCMFEIVLALNPYGETIRADVNKKETGAPFGQSMENVLKKMIGNSGFQELKALPVVYRADGRKKNAATGGHYWDENIPEIQGTLISPEQRPTVVNPRFMSTSVSPKFFTCEQGIEMK